jgi:hypothetical protein
MGIGFLQKGQFFQGIVAWRQEFCDADALRVMDGAPDTKR